MCPFSDATLLAAAESLLPEGDEPEAQVVVLLETERQCESNPKHGALPWASTLAPLIFVMSRKPL